jgi:hypothetical protein
MAISPVSQTDAAKVASQAAATQTQPAEQKPAPAKAQTATTDTVAISNVAKAMMQEVQETAAQTTQEANKGDRQAQRLLAKEAAAKAELQGKNKPSPLNPK